MAESLSYVSWEGRSAPLCQKQGITLARLKGRFHRNKPLIREWRFLRVRYTGLGSSAVEPGGHGGRRPEGVPVRQAG